MLAILLALHAVTGPTPRPAPPAQRFKIISRTTTDIDGTTVGQGMMSFTITTSGFVTINLIDTTGGRLAHVVVDSSAFDAGTFAANLPAAMLEDARGATFHVYVVNGKPRTSIVPTPMNLQAMQLVGGIEMLLSGLRQVTVGDTWADTVKTDTTIAESATAGNRVYTWTVKPDTGNTLEFDGKWSGSAKVGAAAMQMDLKLEGTSQVTAVPGNLAAAASTTGTGQANLNIGGNSLPMKFTTSITVAPIP